MTKLDLPEPELHEIRLDPYRRTVPGADEQQSRRQGGWSTVPRIRKPLNAEAVDENTRPFLQARFNS